MRTRLLAVIALLALAPGIALSADTPRRLTVDDQFSLKDVGDPRLSPDGAWVAYTVTSRDLKKDTTDTDIYMSPVAGGPGVRITTSDKPERAPRFSPDGRWLAFISNRTGSFSQVWLMSRVGGEAVKLTDFKADVSDLAWSPDSTKLALVVSDADPHQKPESEASKDDKETEKPIVVSRLQFKRDGQGYLNDLRTHIHIVDIVSKATRQITSGPFDDEDPVWSPDGKNVAFVSNRTLPDADRTQNTDIFIVSASGGVPRAVARSPRAESSPSFSADGTHVVFVRGGDPKDLWYGASHVAIVPVAGGPARALTETLDRNVMKPRFTADSRHVLFLIEDSGNQHLARVAASSGPVERVVAGEREILAFDVAPSGEVVVLENTTQYPPEISAVRDGQLARVTMVNDAFLKGIRLGKVQRFTAKAPDGTPVDGFITLPPDYREGTKLPAILRIHGGPAAQYANGFDWEWQILAAQGYAVIAANPRGSTGYGTAFSRAIWAEWGGKDTGDVLAAVDHVVAMGIADPDRLGVGGWSYGGILTNYVIATTNRFKAAISGSSISNVLAGYGTDHYQYEYEVELGLPWDTRDDWLKISSPFLEAGKITTPTLFLCGQLDMNVPLLNTEQMYQAVRRIGKAETEMIIYPGQWHGIRTPSYRKDRDERYIAWYDRFLKPPAAGRQGQTPEATSLLGTPLHRPEMAPAAKAAAESGLAKAREDFSKAPDSADAAIWLGRRAAAAGFVREAVEAYTRGIARFPADARFYRHRGHRYVTLREFDKAIADLTKATELIAGKKDEPEPSTADPAVMSSETLHYAIYYHLGLAHYLKGDFANAAKVFRQCVAVAKGSDDQTAGSSDWLYMSLRRLDRPAEAAAVLETISPTMAVRDSRQYFDRLLMYKGVYEPEDLLRAGGDAVSSATYAYAVANWYLYNGRRDEALALMRRIVKGGNWMPFGFIAAEADLARLEREGRESSAR